jgi:hypothetical protein
MLMNKQRHRVLMPTCRPDQRCRWPSAQGIKRNTARGSQDTSIAAAVSETLREALSSKFGTGTTKRSQDGGTSLCLSIEDPPGSSVLAGYTLGTVNVRLTGAETRSTNLDSLTL